MHKTNLITKQHKTYIYCSKLGVGKIFKMFLKEVSYAHQDCIYLIKNNNILLEFNCLSVFHFSIPNMYSKTRMYTYKPPHSILFFSRWKVFISFFQKYLTDHKLWTVVYIYGHNHNTLTILFCSICSLKYIDKTINSTEFILFYSQPKMYSKHKLTYTNCHIQDRYILFYSILFYSSIPKMYSNTQMCKAAQSIML